MKKIDLSGIQPAPKSARSAHPVVSVDDTMEKLLAQFVDVNPRFKQLKNQDETIKKQLAPYIRATYFTRFAGVTPESSTLLANVGNSTVKLTVKNAYSSKVEDEKLIVAAIGQENTDKYFRQSVVLEVNIDNVPEDQQDDFAQKIVALAKAEGHLSAVSMKAVIKPRAGFHEARTSILTTAQNMALDEVMPVTAYPQM